MTKKIRDFIYLDTPRVASLYAQVFEGVAAQIKTEKQKELSRGESSGGPRDTSTENTRESILRTESVVLHDYMYSQLEERLGSAILQARTDILPSPEALRDAMLLRVTGDAVVEDYGRMASFFTKFNELGRGIAYSVLSSGADSDPPVEPKRKKPRKRFSDEAVREMARRLNLEQDEALLDNLKMFNEFFFPGGFQMTIRGQGVHSLAYKVVINRDWLRIQPDQLRALYVEEGPQFSVVGYVTSWPADGVAPAAEQEDQEDQEQSDAAAAVTEDGNEGSMRDSMEGVVGAARGLERKFFVSAARREVIIKPLAVYTEYELGLDDSDAQAR